jgi:hypothetical protein
MHSNDGIEPVESAVEVLALSAGYLLAVRLAGRLST